MALLLDRIFFLVYLVVIVASLSYTIPTLTSLRSQYQSTVLSRAYGGESTMSTGLVGHSGCFVWANNGALIVLKVDLFTRDCPY
ncbi:hypothetical protein RRG08_045665 [Elysia crispata]|uniref:Uncharacterized protein n=1 Tax=Elysia crispata TaxID=231223 RepID=A0AAE1D1E1_9GAST|nr:hypothetical protein RRG08_045665 [Elysia crispata]